MATLQPFQTLFETFGRLPRAHAKGVNREAYDQLEAMLAVPLVNPGGCILLRAPRAGHGKTHLLSRLRDQYEHTHDCILLRASCGYQIGATTVMEDVLRHLAECDSPLQRQTRMDLLARRLFATGLQPLVESGEVPSQDREGALATLRNQPIETFDFHDPGASTAQWTRENFDALHGRLSAELARDCGLPQREVEFWIGVLFRYVAETSELNKRQSLLENTVLDGGRGDGEQMARLEALLAMMTLTKRVVLIADDLEGFSADQSAPLRFATFIVAIRQSVQRLEILLSLNSDVWDGVFVPCLSDGMIDRLSERLVELDPLGQSEMLELLEARAPGYASRILARIDRSRAGTHARGLIKEAARAWPEVSTAPDEEEEAVAAEVPQEMPVDGAGGGGPDLDRPEPQASAAESVVEEPVVEEPVVEEPVVEEPVVEEPVVEEPVVEEPVVEEPVVEEPVVEEPVAASERPLPPPPPRSPSASGPPPVLEEGADSPVDPADLARMDELMKEFRERIRQRNL